MKKYAWFFILFASLMGNEVSAQSKLEFLPHYGFMYEFFSVKPDDNVSDWSAIQYPMLHLGGYVPFVHKNDIVSFGIDAGFQGGFNFRPNGMGYQLQVPAFITARVGANSTRYNEQMLGLSVGAGVVATYWNEPSIKAKNFIPMPSANVDVTLNNRGNKIVARLIVPMMSYKHKTFEINGQKSPFVISMVGLGLLYGF